MIQCPKCSAENPPGNRFCGTCGEELSSLSQAPTVAAPEGEAPHSPAISPHVGRIVSSDSVPAGGFTPGTILADRYRIIGLLGRGGMGEVYRADDLKLGQPVALKFLPPKLAEDSVRRERFFAEVRITRQLSHPNICRVYDIGEVDDRHFLSMEYIDGEDLASLMKRIGHLSNEKALDIARQLVAGLSVAHERGVLHRDLKPANIMLDGHGRVRITDFGLAIAVGDESQAEEIAGTPAYMAPEQLAGKGATVRSDIYSLGLILYEIYTGKKAFTAKTLAELREQKETQTPRAPSELREGIDPVVERVIQRCMEKDPNSRPASVAQLAQTLPGGDPLAAAIAAGETPSPEMVAASGSKEGLRPAVAWGILAFIVAAMLASIAMSSQVFLHRRIPFRNSPEALAERSRLFLREIGYEDESASIAYGFNTNSGLLNYLQNSDKTLNRWRRLDANAILFWYRQSPRPLGISELAAGSTGPDNPPLQYPGEILITLNTEGRLISFRTVPAEELKSEPSINNAFDWKVFFSEAGLDISQWKPVDSRHRPPSYADSRFAWEGSLPNRPGSSIRVEAAALQGKPVSFAILDPWNTGSAPAPQSKLRERIQIAFVIIAVSAVVGGGIFFARMNLRLGRGDRRNATRLALFVLASLIVASVLQIPRISVASLLGAPYLAVLIWILYISLEPFVRRRWPQILVSWTRLLSGNWRDPLVARDILVGCAAGVLTRCIMHFSYNVLPPLIGKAEFARPSLISLDAVLGSRFFLAEFPARTVGSIFIGLFVACLLYVMKILLRNQKAAIAASVVVLALAIQPGNVWAVLLTLIEASLAYFVLIRFGLLAVVLIEFSSFVIMAFPITFQSAWYTGYGYAALAIFAAIVLYAFYTSLGGRPIFGTPRFDD